MPFDPERWQPTPTPRDRLFSGLCSWLGHESARLLFKFYDLARFDLLGTPEHYRQMRGRDLYPIIKANTRRPAQAPVPTDTPAA